MVSEPVTVTPGVWPGQARLVALSKIVARRSLERARSRLDDGEAATQSRLALEELLEDLADLYQADRVTIVEESEDRTTMRITYEWCCGELTAVSNRMGEVDSDSFPWFRRQIADGETVFVPRLSALPEEAGAEREEMARRQSASAVAVPLAFGTQAFGTLALEWRDEHAGPPPEALELSLLQGLVAGELQARQAAATLQRTSRVLRAMIECSDALLRAEDETALLEDVCRIIVEVGGYRLAWVGFGQRDLGHSVTPVAQWGDSDGYLEGLQVTWADIDLGKGPVSRAVRTGLPAAVQSVATDPDFEPWREKALVRGYKSVLAVSLHFGDQLLGALGVYAGDPWAFDGVEIEMMQRFADYLAFGIVALRNRAQRREAEEKLRRTLQSKDELVASISHELRTPLTAVVGFAQLLREDANLSADERSAMIRSIVDEGLDLSNIVEDLLTVAKAEAGTLTVVRVPVDLRAQAAQVHESLREEDAARVALTGPTIQVHADPGRVRQILRNLVSNAIRYGGDRVEVRVMVGDPPRIQVLDDGPGIPYQDRQRIFESYQKAHDAPGVAGSVGLGLAISRTLARLMGGDLTYDHIEGNSVFELAFPQR